MNTSALCVTRWKTHEKRGFSKKGLISISKRVIMPFEEILKGKIPEIVSPLQQGERVEIIPVKDDVKIFSVKRREVKPNSDSA